MPSLKDFKTRFTSKSKKKKAMLSSTPALNQSATTPEIQRHKSMSVPAHLDAQDKGLRTSMKSFPSSQSPTPSARLQIDQHKQLKDTGKPDDRANSSDPDTSLYEYEDDKLVGSLKKSISLPYGSNGRASSESSIDTLGSQLGVDGGTAASSIRIPVFEEVIEPELVTDSLNLAIPKSGSPIQSRKASSHHSPRKSGKTDSLRNSLNASINSRSQQDVSLRQSVEDTEVKLDEQVYHLATLTRDERPKARNDSDMLAYYRKLEGTTEHTMREQEELIDKLKQRNANLEMMNADLMKYKSLLEEHDVESMKKRIRDLEELVYKLNQQVSYCQTHHQHVKDPNGNKVSGLPNDAPTPAWMVDFKYLSPLVKALEEQLSMKTQELTSLKRKFAKYENDIKSLTSDNESLRRSAGSGSGSRDSEAIPKEAWQQLQTQALLVLEENEVLLKQLDIHDERVMRVEVKHDQEIINLEEKLRKLEAERFSLAEQLTNSKYEMQVVKSRYDELKSNSMSKIDQEDHERIVIDFKMKLESLQDLHEKERAAWHMRNSKETMTRQEVEAQLNGVHGDQRALEFELKRKDKEVKGLEDEVSRLEKDVEGANDVISRLLMFTDQTVTEKQSLKHFINSEKKDKKRSVGAIVESELIKDKVVESFKRYKLKAENQIDRLSLKLEKQANEFGIERREYERQIKHLRLLTSEKDALVQEAHKEKQEVENCLEFMWKAAENDTELMNDSLRRNLQELNRTA